MDYSALLALETKCAKQKILLQAKVFPYFNFNRYTFLFLLFAERKHVNFALSAILINWLLFIEKPFSIRMILRRIIVLSDVTVFVLCLPFITNTHVYHLTFFALCASFITHTHAHAHYTEKDFHILWSLVRLAPRIDMRSFIKQQHSQVISQVISTRVRVDGVTSDQWWLRYLLYQTRFFVCCGVTLYSPGRTVHIHFATLTAWCR